MSSHDDRYVTTLSDAKYSNNLNSHCLQELYKRGGPHKDINHKIWSSNKSLAKTDNYKIK